MIMSPPQARLAGLYSAGLAALVIVFAVALQLQAKATPTAVIASNINHKQKRSLSSTQQKKFQSQVKGLL
jgi:hypothetical protein